MALGSFNDGSGAIVLPGSPSLSQALEFTSQMNSVQVAVRSTLNPYPAGVYVFALGGGQFSLNVVTTYQTSTSGEAEMVAWDLLTRLGKSVLGTVNVCGQEWPGCYFIRGDAKLSGFAPATIDFTLSFIRSMPKDSVVGGNTVGEAVTSFGSRTDDADYTFGGVSLGTYTRISSITVGRSPKVDIIPRARGVRIVPLRSGRQVAFEVKGYCRDATAATSVEQRRGKLELAIFTLLQSLPSPENSLVGQGNTFNRLVLESVAVEDTDSYFTAPVTYTFNQLLHVR